MVWPEAALKVQVKFYGVVKSLVPAPSATFELEEGARVKDLLARMADSYGEAFRREVVCDRGRLRADVILAVNGEKVTNQELDTPLASEGNVAEVTVLVIPGLMGG